MTTDGMNLTSPSCVRDLLAQIGLLPSRQRGQNFLIDRNILDILFDVADVGPDDTVLEVGPGLGVVTERLVALAHRVVAVEKDTKLFNFLAQHFQEQVNLTLMHADILDVPLDQSPVAGITRMVSNLPYSVGSRVLVDLAQQPRPPARMVVMVQEEVSQRMAAGPKTREYGLLSLWLQLRYTVTVCRRVKPSCFFPPPEINSSIVCMDLLPQDLLAAPLRPLFYDLSRVLFQHRRKQVGSILTHAVGRELWDTVDVDGWLAACGVNRTARPEALAMEDWCRMTQVLAARKGIDFQ
jgi:16S rRNA (adenine1518-N6/adenine1519-N6)-dimethyltransferase